MRGLSPTSALQIPAGMSCHGASGTLWGAARWGDGLGALGCWCPGRVPAQAFPRGLQEGFSVAVSFPLGFPRSVATAAWVIGVIAWQREPARPRGDGKVGATILGETAAMWGGSGIPRASPAKQSGGTVGNSSKKKVSARLGYNICASGFLWKREPDSFWGPSRTEAREGQGAL